MYFKLSSRFAIGLMWAAVAMSLSSATIAQTYPSKIITIKAAFPAGGPSDAAIRAANPILERNLRQTIVTENIAGAAGSISAMAMLNAKADGYTLLGTTGSDLVVAPLTISSAKYQPERFKLLGVIGSSDFILVSSTAHRFKTIDDVIDYAKKPGNKELTLGHWGRGSTAHIVGADFQSRTGTTFLEVPYKGVAPMLSDITGQHLDLTFAPLGGAILELIKSGNVNAIAVASDSRNPALPNVPTINESARLKNFEYSIWAALFAPPDTPDAIVARLNEAVNEWIASPENVDRVNLNGSRRMAPMSVPQADAFFRAEREKFNSIAASLQLAAQ